MPQELTYPGVYIEEVPSGVRTITGVATSITAFIGRTSRGPVEQPVLVTSYGEYERRFGRLHGAHPGLGDDAPLTYAVRDFYANGGRRALIVRLVNGGAGATWDVQDGGDTKLGLVAANAGSWANELRIAIDHKTREPSDTTLFNLTVFRSDPQVPGVRTEYERHINLSVEDTDPRYVVRVLEQASDLVRVRDDGGGPIVASERPPEVETAAASAGSDSGALGPSDYTGGSTEDKTGIYALEKADIFNLLVIPPDERDGSTDPSVYGDAATYCFQRRAMLIVDPPDAWTANPNSAADDASGGTELGTIGGLVRRNAAVYFPRLRDADPLRGNAVETFTPSGAVAGVIARTDATRGVWKAPAGLEAGVTGIRGLNVPLTDGDSGKLNPVAINALRTFRDAGTVVWGARTMAGRDALADEYKYVPVRRLALYIEESLFRGTQWVVFEPNDEPLWAQIRLNVGTFMHNLFRQGAFQGTSPREAYMVKCDAETTTQADRDLGVVNIVVGFAPLKPAEFVVIKIQQLARQAATG